MAVFAYQRRVRYSDTDQFHAAHHSRVYLWFEEARTELLRAWVEPYQEFERAGIFFPVREGACRYRGLARFDMLLTSRSSRSTVRGASLRFDYRGHRRRRRRSPRAIHAARLRGSGRQGRASPARGARRSSRRLLGSASAADLEHLAVLGGAPSQAMAGRLGADGARAGSPPTASTPPPVRSACLTSSSSSFSRQRWNLPSAVRRMRLHEPQYGSLTGLMKPTTPLAPAKRKLRDSSAAFAGGSASSGPSSASMRRRVSRVGHELRQRHVRGVAAPERHQLDEAHVPVPVDRAPRQVRDVHVVVVARHHAVDLDRHEARLLGGRDAGLDLLERAEAHELLEPLGVERVHVDVERGAGPRPSAAPRAAAGGPRWWSWPRPRRRGSRRCAATMSTMSGRSVGSPPVRRNLRKPTATAARARPSRSRPRSAARARDEGQPAQRHAVDAPQVAVVDDRDPEVVDLPAEAIAGHLGHPQYAAIAKLCVNAPRRLTDGVGGSDARRATAAASRVGDGFAAYAARAAPLAHGSRANARRSRRLRLAVGATPDRRTSGLRGGRARSAATDCRRAGRCRRGLPVPRRIAVDVEEVVDASGTRCRSMPPQRRHRLDRARRRRPRGARRCARPARTATPSCVDDLEVVVDA